MQSNVFWAMLKTQYQVASLMQIALLAHVILVLKSQIRNLAGVSPMQSNVFLAMMKTQHQVASLMQIALLAHVILVLESQIRKLARVPPCSVTYFGPC